MSDERLIRLLETMVDIPALTALSEAAGYEDVAQARDELLDLGHRLARKKRGSALPASKRKNEDLPSPCSSSSPFPPEAVAVANTDGASRGNPGPAAYGCVFSLEDGTLLCAEGEAIGVATNNVAEYRGAIAALARLKAWGLQRIVLRLDSQLVVRQLEGSYRVKDAGLKPLHAQARELLRAFDSIQLQYVPRAQNALADAAANRALDRAKAS